MENYILFFYDASKSSHLKTLAWIQTKSDNVITHDLMKEPITPRRLEELAGQLDCTARDMVNETSGLYIQMYSGSELSENDWLKVLSHEHQMIRLPIAVKNNKAVFLDQPSDALQFEKLLSS
jgi:arsenate reductase-like glutaredoxin family protein